MVIAILVATSMNLQPWIRGMYAAHAVCQLYMMKGFIGASAIMVTD